MTPDSPALSQNDAPAKHTVLVVDDNPLDRYLAGRMIERGPTWVAEFACNGREALERLELSQPDVVLTDLFMPEVDGLQLVEAIRKRFPVLPVILMTALGNEEIALRALRAGAASYVPKRNLGRSLLETLEQVASAARFDRRRLQLLKFVTASESSFCLENDRTLVSPLVAMLQEMLAGMRLVDARDRIRVGVALEEALANALYHGNLGVPSDLKLKDDSSFARLAEERRLQAPYSERRIHVDASLTASEATIIIRDDGTGFDTSKLPDPTDPANLERPCGRGLLLIRTFMDEVRYNGNGTQITMVKRRKAAS